MEIYTKRELTTEEKLEDENLNFYGSNEAEVELLNMIKEVLEITNYTFKKEHDSFKDVIVTENEFTDKELINIALNTFLELITDPSGINFLIGAEPEKLKNIEYVSILTRIKNLINCTIDGFSLNLDTKGTYTSGEVLLVQLEEVVEEDKEKERQLRKEFLKSKKEEIEKELATLEAK